MWSKNLFVLLQVCLLFSPGFEVSSRKLSNIFRSGTKKTSGKNSHKKIQPSAPPHPVGWGNNEAQQKHFVPAQTQPKPIGIYFSNLTLKNVCQLSFLTTFFFKICI